MSHTNSTTHYSLPQFIGTDTPAWLTDINGAFSATDAAIYAREQDIATNAGNITINTGDITNLKTRMTNAENDITSLTNDLDADETTIGNHTTAIGNLQNAVSGISTQIANDVWDDVDITVPAASWSGGTFTLTDAKFALNKVKFVTLDPDWLSNATADEVAEAAGAMIMAISEAAGSITIKAFGGAPTIAIDFKVLIADSHI